MAQKKTMKIAFANGGIVPGVELRPAKEKQRDKNVLPDEAVSVSARYGKQLVDDKFAYEVTGKNSSPASATSDEQKQSLEAEKAKKAEVEKAKKIADAQADVTRAEETLKLADNDVDKAAAQEMLDAAALALNDLQAE